jgi:hypothetical protein
LESHTVGQIVFPSRNQCPKAEGSGDIQKGQAKEKRVEDPLLWFENGKLNQLTGKTAVYIAFGGVAVFQPKTALPVPINTSQAGIPVPLELFWLRLPIVIGWLVTSPVVQRAVVRFHWNC